MIQDLLQFIRLTHLFQKVVRVIYVKDEERYENDMEHSYQLAMSAWYLIEKDHLAFNLEKVLGYALVHDLVEVYAGDTYIYADAATKASKADREEAAALQLAKEFPEFPNLHHLIQGYELREDDESRFVYALDKLLPLLNIYLDGGRIWRSKSITLEQLREVKDSKIALSPEVTPYYLEMITILEENRQLFTRPVS
jgi:putative hydrolase of HD superfamily